MDTGGVGNGERVSSSKKVSLAPNELEANGRRSQMQAKEAADKKRRSRQKGSDGGGRCNYPPPKDKSRVAEMNLSCGDVAVPNPDLMRCSLSDKKKPLSQRSDLCQNPVSGFRLKKSWRPRILNYLDKFACPV